MGVWKLDKIRNERIRVIESLEIANKVQERRLKWYGHCDEKRAALLGKEGDGNERWEKEDLGEDGWTK